MALLQVGAGPPLAVAVTMTDLAQLRLRTASGDADAQSELILRLVAAPKTPADREEGMRLLLAACDRGDADAFMIQATLAARGVGRKQDFDEAVALLSRAAELGHASARGQLRVLGGKYDRATWFAPMQLRQHHTAPRVFTIEKLLPANVCKWFIESARARLEPTMVRDGITGRDVMHPGRSATSAVADVLERDLLVQFTNLRIAGAIQTHVGQQESTLFLHYGPGQEYQAHYDLIRPQDEAGCMHELQTLGQRIVTVLVYLNDGYEGGETHFPHLNWAYKGNTGDALIFWNMSATGERERLSLHAGTPVKAGEKWLLSKWVRAKPVPLI